MSSDPAQRELVKSHVAARIESFVDPEARKKVFAALPSMPESAAGAVLRALALNLSASDEASLLGLLDREIAPVSFNRPSSGGMDAVTPASAEYLACIAIPRLAKIGSPKARERVLGFLDSKSFRVRRATLECVLLDTNFDQEAILRNVLRGSPDDIVLVVQSADAVRSPEILRGLLEKVGEIDPASGLPFAAAWISQGRFDARSLESLIARADDTAAFAFGKTLADALARDRDRSAAAMGAALAGLSGRKSEKILPIVAQALRSGDVPVRQAAVLAARNTFSVAAAEILIETLKDSEESIRNAARQALEAIDLYLTEKKNWEERIDRLKSGAPASKPAGS